MKKCVATVLAFGLCFTAGFFTGCDDHVHSFKNYVAKEATCTESGLLERTCDCGKKEYEEIEAKEHCYENGTCTVCNQKESASSSLSGFYTFDKMYQQYKAYNLTATTEEQFYEDLDNTAISSIFINQFGQTVACVDGLYVNVGAVKGNFQIKELQPYYNHTVNTIAVQDGKVSVVANYLQSDIGYIGAIAATENPIDGLLINQDNYLVFHFANNMIMVAGKIEDGESETDEKTLIYSVADSQTSKLAVCGALNRNVEQVEIPVSHLGKSVVEVYGNAFKEYIKLQSVKLSNQITKIGYGAFYGCTALKKIYIPATVTKIELNAFQGCTNLTVYYQGTPQQWSEISVGSQGNDALSSAEIICNSMVW